MPPPATNLTPSLGVVKARYFCGAASTSSDSVRRLTLALVVEDRLGARNPTSLLQPLPSMASSRAFQISMQGNGLRGKTADVNASL